MTHIITNNSHHLTVLSNDFSKKLCIDRVTVLQGAVFNGDGTTAQHDLGFRGYSMSIYGIKKGQENDIFSSGFHRYEKRLNWVTPNGKTYNLKRFSDKKKKDMIALLETFMKGQFYDAWVELTKK